MLAVALSDEDYEEFLAWYKTIPSNSEMKIPYPKHSWRDTIPFFRWIQNERPKDWARIVWEIE